MNKKIFCLIGIISVFLALVVRVMAGPGAARHADQVESLGMCDITAEIQASSPDVYINGQPAALMGDSLGNATYSGCFDMGAFSGRITTGSSSVFINGRPAVRDGDSCQVEYTYFAPPFWNYVQYTGRVITSSGDVFIGP